MKIDSYKIIYLKMALFVVVPLLLYGMVFRTLLNARGEAEKIQTANAFEEDTHSLRVALKAAMDNSLEDRSKIETHFVRKDDIVNFINNLEKLGNDNGVVANVSSLGELWQDQNSGSLAISLHVAGTFTDVYNYLLLLEETPQKLTLDDIQLIAGDSGAPTTIKALGPHTSIWTADIRATVVHYIK
ncbi:MAG: hypothetical protein WC764_02635 [Candidatus Paceibacterota bacterium]|jgi:Tfp pilus assembly protein PilO